jgi:carbon monoxide dehydrogenase subunit G
MAQETENATSEIKDKASDLKDKASSNGGGGVISSLLSKEIVIPALATAGTVAAYAIKKGMSEATDKAEDEAENVGSRAAQGAKKGLAGGLGGMASKAFGGGGGGGGSAKKTRRLPIQRWTDVAAPIETVYERWTDFEEFPSFMHRVLNVEKEDDTIKWDEKIWFSKRHWEGEITERRKNERIAWKTTSGMAHAGVVTFHRMEKNLTRVMVDMDFVPQGMIEKMASGMRFVKRAVEADLARFKAYVELGEAKDLEYNVKPEEREGDDKNKDDDKNQSDENGNENEASDDDKEREGDRETAGARS